MKIAINADINAVAWIGRSFRPVEGKLDNNFNRWGQYFYGVDNEFMLETDNALYYAVFNYDKSNSLSKTESFERLGIKMSDVTQITELWTNTKAEFDATGVKVNVPACDVRLYRLEKGNWSSSVPQLRSDNGNITITKSLGNLLVKAPKAILTLDIYGADGTKNSCHTYKNSTQANINIGNLPKNMLILRVGMADVQILTRKVTI